jgi:hypothetical protein
MPANICPIVPITFFKAGVPFEFVDIAAESFHMDIHQTQARLWQRSGAWGGVLYAHTYGDPGTPHDFFRELKRNWPDMLVIDDRCLCIPDLDPNAEMAADVALYSTGYGKIVQLGSAGFAFVKDGVPCGHSHLEFQEDNLAALEAEYKECVRVRRPYVYHDSGWLQSDASLPSWAAFRERVQNALATSVAHRRSINALYNSRIPADLQLAERFQLWRFNLRMANPERALRALFEKGLFASSHYAALTGIMGRGTGAIAQELGDHVINLFNDHHYTLEMAEQTSEIIRRSA